MTSPLTKQTCDGADDFQTLLPCGLQKIVLIEYTWNTKLVPYQRTISDAVMSSDSKGHLPLTLTMRMTAPPEGARSGKKVRLSASGTGPCDPKKHMVWTGKDGPEFEDELFADPPSGPELTRWLLEEAQTAPEDERDGQVAAALLISGAIRSMGLTAFFDALYRPIFSRRHYDADIVTCGNPGNSTTRRGRVEAIVYPSEKYTLTLKIPSDIKTQKYISEEFGDKPAGWSDKADEPSLKLKINDRQVSASVDLAKVYQFITDAESAVKALDKLFSASPVKAGFYVTGKVKFLYGEVEASWQWREKGNADVHFWWSLSGKMTLIDASLTLNYGYYILGVEAKFYGTINGKAEIKISHDRATGYEGPQYDGSGQALVNIPATGTVTLKGGIMANVRVLEVDANVSVPFVFKGGIKLFPQGSVLGLGLDSVYIDKIKLTVHVDMNGWWEYDADASLTDSRKQLFGGVSVGSSGSW